MSAFDDLQRQLSKSVGDRAAAAPGAGTAASESAATIADATSTATRPTRRWWTTRPFALALVGLTIAGTATAATVALRSEPSSGLDSRLPPIAGAPIPREVANRYLVTMTPNLAIGKAGWCLSDAQARGDRPLLSAGGCNEDAVSDRAPVIARSTTTTSIPGTNDLQTMRTFFTAIVDARVAAVRMADGRVLRPIAAAGLPEGFRSVVTVIPKDVDPIYLDADGDPIRGADAEISTREDPQPFRMTDQRTPAPWAIRADLGSARDRSAVRIGAGYELDSGPRPNPGLNGRPFRSVSTARIGYRGREYQATWLVDAEQPSARAAPLPGGARTDPRTGITTVDGPGVFQALTARREGTGWLVVRGPGAKARETVLDTLRVGPGARP